MTSEIERARRVTVPELTASVRANWWHVLWLGVVASSLVAALLAHEWAVIGVINDPSDIADYHFGSEPMLGHGGWHYASAQVYATTAALECIVASALAVLLFITVRRKSWYWLGAAVSLFVLNHLTLFAIGKLLFARP